MEVQSYQQRAVPVPLRLLVPGLVVLLALYAVLPVMMTVDRAATGASIMRNTPALSPADLDVAVAAALAYTIVLHVVSAVLALWFTLKTVRGRRWARIALTAFLVLLTLGSLNSVTAGAEYLWAVISTDAVQLAMIALLWLPASARRFFAAG
ncbi:hypothetical protein ACFOY2_47900 [Nonomuraea purpurea]|uniref:DUF2569 domain-containing protein n=1 Tax=Nonomuraea purpurea TaxID=1849276 RepID=A0ABV8GQ63_9ACTN